MADSELNNVAEPGPSPVRADSLRAGIVESAAAVRRYLFGLCGRWHEAEDIAQDALLKAWAARERFDGRTDVRTWVFVIARNAWVDRIRRRQSRPREETMIEEAVDPGLSSSPPAVVGQSELAAAVEAALSTLPPEQREALALRESDGLTFQQAAEVLDVPVATVKSRVRYALKKLAEQLEPLRRELET